MNDDNRAAMVAKIRALADFVETRTDLPVPNSVGAQHSLLTAGTDNADTVRNAAQALGEEPTITWDSAFVVHSLSKYPLTVEYAVHGSLTEDGA